MRWTFHYAPEGLKDWPSGHKGTEFIQFYVEDEAAVRVGYFGYAKGTHVFEYGRAGFGFKFDVIAQEAAHLSLDPGQHDERRLGPSCEVWVDDEIVGRMANEMAVHFVSDIVDVLQTSVLLSRTLHSGLLGLPIRHVNFRHKELQRLAANNGNAR